METYSKEIKGFSLVELLVVISIIATLTAILLPNFMGARERANDAKKIQDLSSMKNALRMYYNDHQAYPTLGIGPSMLDINFTTYMAGVMNLGYTYVYAPSVDGNSFAIRIPLESTSGGDNNAAASQIKCGLTPTPGYYAICAN